MHVIINTPIAGELEKKRNIKKSWQSERKRKRKGGREGKIITQKHKTRFCLNAALSVSHVFSPCM